MLMMVFFGFVMIIMRMFRQNTTSQYLLQSYCQMRSFFTTFSNKQTTDWKQGHKSDGSGMAFRLGACFFGARLKLQFHEDLYQASCVYEMSGHYRMSGWIIEWASCVCDCERVWLYGNKWHVICVGQGVMLSCRDAGWIKSEDIKCPAQSVKFEII